jgi:cytochrome c551/c552
MTSRCFGIPAAALAVFVLSSVDQALVAQPKVDETRGVAALASRSGCRRCHNVDSKRIGPPFRDIAAKYKTQDGARAALIEKVKKGGEGNWTDVTGGIKMPPHSGLLSDGEISQLVDWILSR